MAIYTSNMTEIKRTAYRIGQRVKYTGDMANAGGSGVIIGESGECYHDVVLNDGRLLHQVIIDDEQTPGGRLYVVEGVAGAEEIAALIACAELKDAADMAASEKAASDRSDIKDRLALEYPDLVRVADDSNATAKNIRKLLTSARPGNATRGSV